MDIPFAKKELPYLTASQMAEVDRAMIQDYHIELIQMMENAGRNLARLAQIRFLGHNLAGKHIVILAGTGGNGGGVLVSARYLHNWGANVLVFLTRTDRRFTPIPAHQLDILHRLRVSTNPATEIRSANQPDLIIDGLIGYNLKGEPYGSTADMIRWCNHQSVPVLSLDVPSGVDATTGTVFSSAIHATATLTLALPKEGLRAPDVEALTGELYLADVSVPPELYANIDPNLEVDALFATGDILRIW